MQSFRFLLFFALIWSVADLSAQTVLWGGNADAQFDGGLNGWTAVGVSDDNALWEHSADATASTGAYAGTTPIGSASAGNGAALFNSDFLDNDGIQGNFGGGASPSPHTGELISPTIDLSMSGHVTLKFNQYYRNYVSTCAVAFSKDDGMTWSDPIIFNDDLATNASTDPGDVKRIPLTTANTSTFKIKFIFDGDYYFWLVDDVEIITSLDNDMQVNSNWYAIAPNRMTPKSQVEPFTFMADIQNNGGTDQENVALKMEIRNDQTNALFWESTLDYGTVMVDSIVENVPFTEYFDADTNTLFYEGTYTISAENPDMNTDNNSLSFKFELSQEIFAKEKGGDVPVRPSGEVTFAYGNYYYSKNGGYYADKAWFGVGNASPGDLNGVSVGLNLYEWVDNGDDEIDATELTLAAFGYHTFTGGGSQHQLISVDLQGTNNDKHLLLPETEYILMCEYDEQNGVEFFVSSSDAQDYGGQIFNSDPLNNPASPGTRFAGVLEAQGNDVYSTLGFGWDLVPVVRLEIAPVVIDVEEVEEKEAIALNVFPNPVAATLNVQLELEENIQKASLNVVDGIGRVVMSQNINPSIDKNHSLDVSGLAAGTYLLNIQTENGKTSKTFTIAR